MAGFAGAAEVADSITERVGRPDAQSLADAQATINHTSPEFRAAAHDGFDARALVYAMLLSPEPATASQQIAHLQTNADPGIAARTAQLTTVRESTQLQKLTLVEMAIPALKSLSKRQYQRFMQNTATLITADGQVDVFEWVLHRVLTKDLYGHFEGPQNYHGRVKDLQRFKDDVSKVLSMIASHGHHDVEEQLAAYAKAISGLNMHTTFEKQDTFNYQRMNDALGRLRKLAPLAKPALIKACLLAAEYDGTINDDEYALLQGIAATLDCPLPARLNTTT